MRIIEGKFKGEGKKIAIIISKFNNIITEKLLNGAIDGLIRNGVSKENISVYWVPGAFEIPLLLSKLTRNNKNYDGIITLGAVIRGETPHFNYIASETTKGIAQIALHSDIPISFGVLTTDTVEQAIDRAGAKAGNKGFDAALSLLEMMDLYNNL
ncbi:6,7-dimethyl-8-ribityllumazine synthase [bacterium]|nr:6,7-dimethyl-8-ribityllumazine synthase [bacterium]